MSGGMYVNDFDVGLIGATVINATYTTPPLSYPARDIYGRAGQARTGSLAKVGTRTLNVTATVRGSTVTAMEANLDALRALFMAEADVRFETTPDRAVRCVLANMALTPINGPQFLNTACIVALSLTAYDPYAYGVYLSAAALTPVPVPVSLGSAPSTPLLRINGATDPVVTVRDAAGNMKQTLGLVITLGANDYIEVDCDAMTITKSVAGTRTDALSTLDSGDFLVLDPADNPTIEVDNGGGEALYRKAWL
jgi:phage-related protein